MTAEGEMEVVCTIIKRLYIGDKWEHVKEFDRSVDGVAYWIQRCLCYPAGQRSLESASTGIKLGGSSNGDNEDGSWKEWC